MESKPLRRLVFGHRVKDVKPALRDRSQDIRRMKACFHDAGYEISEEDLAAAWLSYSEGASVDWLTLPSSDGQLLATLLGARAPLLRDPSRPHRQWKAQLVDVRTRPELDLVGRLPGAAHIAWAFYPDTRTNPDFLAQLPSQAAHEALKQKMIAAFPQATPPAKK